MSTYFLMWNIIGSSVFIVLILLHITLRNAEQEEREREELEKRRKDRFEEREAREKKELRELLLGLSINESKEVKELMRKTEPNHRLVYENYMLDIYMYEIYDYDTCEKIYVIFDWKYACYYYNWHAYTGNDSDIIRIAEYHRSLRGDEEGL